MRFIELTDSQVRQVRTLWPKTAPRVALVSLSEYTLWRSVFRTLQASFDEHFGVRPQTCLALRNLPIMQWIAKLVSPETIPGMVVAPDMSVPKVFKARFAGQRGFDQYAECSIALALLGNVAQIAGVRAIPIESPLKPRDGTWDHVFVLPRNPDREALMLGLYGSCALSMDDIAIEPHDDVCFVRHHEDRFSSAVLLDHDGDEVWHKFTQLLDQQGLLTIPRAFKPLQITNWDRFRHPIWTTIYPFDYFADRVAQDPDWDDCVLLHEQYPPLRYRDVLRDPVLSLDLAMREFWVWREKCQSGFPDLTMRWIPMFKYPWLMDASHQWIPILVIPDGF